VNSASFSGAFSGAYGLSPSQVSEFLNAGAINFESKNSYSASNWASAKPSIAVSLRSLPAGGGSLLPLEFTYSLSWSELSEILGRETAKVDDVAGLFGYLKLLFESGEGTYSPVVDADGEYGIAAGQALSSGALTFSSGNNGLTLTLQMWLGDVKAASDGKPRLIDGRLVMADGVADGTVAGSMWLLKRTGGSGGGVSSGSGGGGCDAGFGLLALALGLTWGLRFQRGACRPE
jgi:hypothetical protein